jgi:RNA polymerase-binding transcription factor DksA
VERSDIGELLEVERAHAIARIQAMTADLDGIVEASLDSNADDEHDPEGATIAFERAQLINLIADARACLEDIDQAVARLASGTYRSCEGCGREIDLERLAARPATRTCIDCAASVRPA